LEKINNYRRIKLDPYHITLIILWGLIVFLVLCLIKEILPKRKKK